MQFVKALLVLQPIIQSETATAFVKARFSTTLRFQRAPSSDRPLFDEHANCNYQPCQTCHEIRSTSQLLTSFHSFLSVLYGIR
ncbi:hypothetical protein GGR57DRAFT_458727 [Xylariaceae sp. FL1272]|nr:hypothetical protein GGR57DRAFT_458727 [Xylariaceae sp. FL1272]